MRKVLVLVEISRGVLFARSHLGDQEVHVLLDEDVDLLLEDLLDLVFALAAEVGGCLRDSARHQSIALIGYFSGQIAGGLVDLLALRTVSKHLYQSLAVIFAR